MHTLLFFPQYGLQMLQLLLCYHSLQKQHQAWFHYWYVQRIEPHRLRDNKPRTPDLGWCCCCNVAWSFSDAWRCLSETVLTSQTIEWLRERTKYLDIFLFSAHHSIHHTCSISCHCIHQLLLHHPKFYSLCLRIHLFCIISLIRHINLYESSVNVSVCYVWWQSSINVPLSHDTTEF